VRRIINRVDSAGNGDSGSFVGKAYLAGLGRFAHQLLRIDAAHTLAAMVEADELREPPHIVLRYRRTNLERTRSKA